MDVAGGNTYIAPNAPLGGAHPTPGNGAIAGKSRQEQ
jgi:hypothetical protein